MPIERHFNDSNSRSQMLGHSDLINKDGARRFLLEKTQHMIGGFGKTPGNPPGKYVLDPLGMSNN
jgi:prenyltransferase beta subunit